MKLLGSQNDPKKNSGSLMGIFSRVPRLTSLFACVFVALTLASGCSTQGKQGLKADSIDTRTSLGSVVSVAFGPDGRLWRLIPTEDYVYVDYSLDQGKSFSNPIAVNQWRQRVKAGSEDRPAIAVDGEGRIFVIYFSEDPLPWSTYFSYSTDGGQTFSTPEFVSDQADSALHYQDALSVSPAGRLYVFWHDERGKEQEPSPGAALYYASRKALDPTPFVNREIEDSMCECCRIAVDFDGDDTPVVFTRFVYPEDTRDHGLLRLNHDTETWSAWRVTDDDWRIHACPEHGPALSIAANGRYHMSWFTQGRNRQGLFYRYADKRGKQFSKPMPIGDSARLAGHADVLAIGERVVLTWQEYDGENTSIKAMQSSDGGEQWSEAGTLLIAGSQADYPFLVSDGSSIYLSWNTRELGFQLKPIEAGL